MSSKIYKNRPSIKEVDIGKKDQSIEDYSIDDTERYKKDEFDNIQEIKENGEEKKVEPEKLANIMNGDKNDSKAKLQS